MKASHLLKLTAISLLGLTISAHAATYKGSYKGESYMPSWTPYWYAGWNLGVSDVNDVGTVANPKQTGPGWSADMGYQWTPMFGAELGFTQYHNSNEDDRATSTNFGS